MFQYLGLDWFAMVPTFSAIYLLGNKSRVGFLIMILGNVCWAAIGVWAQSYGMLLANLGFLAMNVRGYVKWAPAPVTPEEKQLLDSRLADFQKHPS